MKKLYIFFIAAILVSATLSSCKLEEGVDPNTPLSPGSLAGTSMTFKANSTDITYTTCYSNNQTIGSVNLLTIQGVNLTNGNPGADNFEIQINKDPSTLQSGDTFTVSTVPSAINSAVLFYSTDADHDFSTQYKKPEGIVKLTDVTATTIKGTFSGVLYKADDEDAATVEYTVTSGSFTAARL